MKHALVSRVLLTLLLALVSSLSGVHGADPPHLASFKKLQGITQKIHARIREKREIKDKELADLGTEGMELVGDTAAALKDHFQTLIKSIFREKSRSWEDFAFEPKPDELALLTVLLRADVIGGNPSRPLAFLDGLAANLHLSSVWLLSAHAFVLGSGKNRLPYGDYRTIRTQMERNAELLKQIFPQIVSFPIGTISEEGKYDPSSARASELLDFFAVPPKNELPAEAKKMLNGLISLIDGEILGFDSYRRSYPQKNSEAVLNFLSDELVNEPGALDCIQVARGLSDFDGKICNPPAFAKSLARYLDFYKKVGSGQTQILPTIEEFLGSLYEEKGNQTTAADLTALSKELVAHIERSSFHPRIKERWPNLEKKIFGDADALKKLMGKGPQLHAFLAEAIRSEGLVSTLGFDGDYFENVEAVKILQERFEKEKLDQRGQLTRVRVTDACTPFLEGKDTSWTVNSLVAAQLPPRLESSADGFQRLVFAHEVMVGETQSIQNSKLEERMVSGLGGYYALRLLIPNLVQLRLLLEKGVPKDLEELAEVKEKEISEPLALVKVHYHFPDTAYLISQTERAFSQMVNASWKGGNDKNAEIKVKIAAFITKYRQELNAGAGTLREIIGAKEQLKLEAAKMASPAIAEVLQIPVEFTGEYDKRYAAQINDSLINTFLPAMIKDYVNRKYPATKRDRELYAKHYNELKSTFTLDQFMDQLDWYWGMDLVRAYKDEFAKEGVGEFRFADVRAGKKRSDELPPKPLRRPDYMGVEEMKLLWAYPHFAARLLNHTMESFQRKLDYLEYAEKKMFYRFPMLKWEDNYKTYEDTRYNLVLSAFLVHGQKQIKDVWERKEAAKLLDYVSPNLPLLDLVLRFHPDQKKGMCQIHKDRGQWEKGTDVALTSTAAVASTLALVPPLAPVALAIDAGILIVEGVRAYGKYQEMVSAEALWVTGSAQMESSVYEDGGYLMRELDARFGESLSRVALQAVTMTPGVVANLPMVARLPATIGKSVRSGFTGWRVAHAEYRAAIAAERAAAQLAIAAHPKTFWWAVAGGRLAKALSFTKAARDHLMFPFVKLGLAQRWTQRTLFQRLYPHLAWRRAHKLLWNGGGLVKDAVLSLPFSVVGYTWGAGRLAKGVAMYGMYELTLWGVHSVRNAQEVATAMMVERVQADPATYGDLVMAMHEGEITHSEMMAIIELDDTLGAKYRESLTEWAKGFNESSSADERKETLANFATLEGELAKELKGLEGQNGFDPQRARMLRRVLRDSKRLRLELSSAQIK